MGRGLGFIVGGALAGIGKGMAQQVEEDALERRDRRLAEARAQEAKQSHGYRMTEQADQYTRAGENDAQSDQRGHNYRVTEKGLDYANQNALADKGTAAQLERDRLNHQRDMEKLEKEWGYRMSDADKDRAFRAQQELGKPVDIITDEQTGERILIYPDPEQKSGVLRVRIAGVDTRKPKTGTSGGSSLLLNPGGARGGQPAKVPSDNAAYVFNPVTGELEPNKAK